MAVFEYRAVARATGRNQKGMIDADGPVQARQKLRDQGLFPTSIKERSDAVSADAKGGERRLFGGGRLSTRDIALVTRQMATLMRAGMPVVGSLDALIEQTSKQRLRAAIYDIRDRVNSGTSLGDAMAAHPRVFSNLYVNMVRAGEASGTLEDVLLRLADILEHQSKLKAQVLSSLAYPAFMFVFAIAVIVFLMTVIVPKIIKIFLKQEIELPLATKILIRTSNVISHWWWLILAVLGLIYLLWRLWLSRERGRRTWDRWKLRFPLYGPLHLKLVSARFARTLGTMLQSGLTMLPALEVVKSVLENAHVQSSMDDIKASVRRGRELSQPLRETGLFPPMLLHMVELGQRSGEIEDMMVHVADTYDDDVRLTIDAAVGLLEPIIIVIMGLFVGFLVLAILLPILQMSTNI